MRRPSSRPVVAVAPVVLPPVRRPAAPAGLYGDEVPAEVTAPVAAPAPTGWAPQQPPHGWATPPAGPAFPGGPVQGPGMQAPSAAWLPVAAPLEPPSPKRSRSGGPGRQFGTGALVAAVVVAAVLAGGIGSAVGLASGGSSSPSSAGPNVTIGSSGGSTSPTSVNRPQGSVAAIAAKVLPSVVTIREQDSTGGGVGSGIILTQDGYILTNNHVVAAGADGGKITVILNGESVVDELPATIVGRDPVTDLAVIKIALAGLPPITLGHSSALAVGDSVIAVGAPLELSGTVTTGIVSALDRRVDLPAEGSTPAGSIDGEIQTDAAINPGNSGGALVDSNGDLVGINSAIASLPTSDSTAQTGSIGLGFAIPIDYAEIVATQIIKTGTVTHPYLGVSIAPVAGRDSTGKALAGALIAKPTDDNGNPNGAAVASGSPADKAGLKEGDVITKVGDSVVTGPTDLVLAVRQHAVGDKVVITYTRSGSSATTTVTLVDRAS